MRGSSLRLKLRIIHKHKRGCRWVRQDLWTSPWWLPGKMVWRNKAGYGRGHSMWLVAECHLTNCEGRVLIHCDEIAEAVQRQLRSVPGFGKSEPPATAP